MTTQEELNVAVWYAMRHGCFHPMPNPSPNAGVDEWNRWGAMRHLHDVVARSPEIAAIVERHATKLTRSAPFTK